ncbi:hypothetical protein BHE74_00040748 [Ensete ventricosum]|nr:hypothetical protein BHE74_00040748 [Ensete ventricosum]
MRLLVICGEAEDSKEAFISTNLGGLDASWKRTESAVTEGNRKCRSVVGQAREKACCQRRKEDGNEIRSDGSCFFRRCYYCSDCNKLARNAAGGELRHRKPVGESHPPRSGVDGHFGGSAEVEWHEAMGQARRRWKEGMEVVPDKEALPPLEDQPELSVPVLRHVDEVGDGEGSIGRAGSGEGELTEGVDGDREDNKNKSKCLWHRLSASTGPRGRSGATRVSSQKVLMVTKKTSRIRANACGMCFVPTLGRGAGAGAEMPSVPLLLLLVEGQQPGRWKEGMEVVPDKEELPPLEDQPELLVLVLQHADEAGNGEGSIV